MGKYQWQGENIKVKFGNCIVKRNKEKPIYWYNYECFLQYGDKACIPAIQITYKKERVFMIANHFGIGVHKLINGGWPNYTHFSLDGIFSTNPQLKYAEFDLDGYSEYEAKREKWRQKTFPKEYEKILQLRAIMTKE